MNTLTISNCPSMILASNTFINVPVILQYEDTPLIQFVRKETAGFTTQIPIFHSDGTRLAKVIGSQLYLTDAGKKAGVTLTHPDKMTVCKQGDRVLFEIRREEAAALKTQAELYSPDGYFLKCTDSPTPELIDTSGNALEIGLCRMEGNTISGCRIGIWVKRESFTIGAN